MWWVGCQLFFSFALKAGSSSPAEEQSYDWNSTWNAGHEFISPHKCNNEDLLGTCATNGFYFPFWNWIVIPPFTHHLPIIYPSFTPMMGVYSLYLPIIYPSWESHHGNPRNSWWDDHNYFQGYKSIFPHKNPEITWNSHFFNHGWF